MVHPSLAKRRRDAEKGYCFPDTEKMVPHGPPWLTAGCAEDRRVHIILSLDLSDSWCPMVHPIKTKKIRVKEVLLLPTLRGKLILYSALYILHWGNRSTRSIKSKDITSLCSQSIH
jgi:hypothetical protein